MKLAVRLFAGMLCIAFGAFGVCGESMCRVPEVLRLHVLANSDDEWDQAVKLRVRDAVLDCFAETDTLMEAEEMLLSRGGEILDRVEKTLDENGAGYGAQLRYGIEHYPERVYGETTYPAGDYLSLNIVLGEGEGHNWWCVLFPPLCLKSIRNEKQVGDKVRLESFLWQLLQKWRTTG